MGNLTDTRKTAQRFLDEDPRCRKFYEELWCKLHKAGCVLPSSGDTAKVFDDFVNKGVPTNPQKLNYEEAEAVYQIIGGLGCLIQLVLAKEQM